MIPVPCGSKNEACRSSAVIVLPVVVGGGDTGALGNVAVAVPIASKDTRLVPRPSVQQHALTVVARIPADAQAEVERRLDAAQKSVLAGLARVKTLHYGRFVVFKCASGDAALAFESNYDGDEQAHLEELERQIGPHLDAFFAPCDGYEPGGFVSFARGAAHSVPPRTFYMGHPGLSVQQILHDRDVRAAIQSWLDAKERAGLLASMHATDIARGLKDHLATQGLQVGPVDRGLPQQPWAGLTFYGMAVGYALVEAVLALVALVVHEPADRRAEKTDPPVLLSDHDPGVDALIDAEDHHFQNGLTHVVPVKPGPFRSAALRLALSLVDQAARRICYDGTLGGIASIHFARWVLLNDGTLVFFSNYDGSWESYLGDFIDKAHWFLTAIWTNTRWFPDTYGLAFGGASAEASFKQWARTFQVQNQIWYSAYPELSVDNVIDNATIRELAGGELLHEDEVRRWLTLL
jgi:hypothetical protein